MKQHMTQMELTKTRRLIERGITDIAEIQEYVYCHRDCIVKVLEQYEIEIPEPPAPPKRKTVTKKVTKSKTGGGAAARAAASLDMMDPLS